MSADARLQNISFVDIGVNLTDDMYKGQYHGKQSHPSDLDKVLQRARRAGVGAQIATAGTVDDVKSVLALVKDHSDLFATAGVHPTRTAQVSATYIDDLRALLQAHAITVAPGGKIVAIGECGLDYDRLQFADKDVQKAHFAEQLSLSCDYSLPLFLHCRAAQFDFLEILNKYVDRIAQANTNDSSRADKHARKRIGVAHCFTGSVAEVRELLEAGLFIGLTGCSFKTIEGIDVAKAIPLERLLLETDAPWCDMRATHASSSPLKQFAQSHSDLYELFAPDSVKKEKWSADKMVKSRNEPCTLGAVAAVVAQAKGVDIKIVAEAVRDNTRFLFGI